jgi:hypothetical protein
MAKSSEKKVRRIEIEKVKNGKGGHLHRVVTHFHHSPGKEGKGLSAAMPSYHEPEETYHTSAGAAHKHVRGLMNQMTATPEEPIDNDEEPEEDEPEGEGKGAAEEY